MRPAYIWSISAVAHVVLLLVAFGILSAPRLFATVPPEAIDVDIVRPEQVGASSTEPQAQSGSPAAPTASTAPRADPATPTYTSLFPWPVPAETDRQAGDYRTFESASDASADELGAFKARLMTCWAPIAGAKKLTASLRIGLRPDGTLTGPPELVEGSASPDGLTLAQSAMRAIRQCEPYGGLPADKYNSWKQLSLTFTPDGVKVAAVTK